MSNAIVCFCSEPSVAMAEDDPPSAVLEARLQTALATRPLLVWLRNRGLGSAHPGLELARRAHPLRARRPAGPRDGLDEFVPVFID